MPKKFGRGHGSNSWDPGWCWGEPRRGLGGAAPQPAELLPLPLPAPGGGGSQDLPGGPPRPKGYKGGGGGAPGHARSSSSLRPELARVSLALAVWRLAARATAARTAGAIAPGLRPARAPEFAPHLNQAKELAAPSPGPCL